jgi:hypothetical protein
MIILDDEADGTLDSLCCDVCTFSCACRAEWIQRPVVHIRFPILDPFLVYHSNKVCPPLFACESGFTIN